MCKSGNPARGDDGKSASYAQARHQVDVVRREIKNVFANLDVLITPTQRGLAPLIVPQQLAANALRSGGAPAGAGGPYDYGSVRRLQRIRPAHRTTN